MLLTTNYGLKKPEGTDNFDIANENYNMDIIDSTMKANANAAAAAQSTANAAIPSSQKGAASGVPQLDVNALIQSLNLPKASASALGAVKIGSNISLAGDGTISVPSFPASGITGVIPIANGGTGSSTQNFVDLTTAQTIGGPKTFSNSATLTGTTHINDDGANGTWIGFYKSDKTTRIGYVGGANSNTTDITVSADNGTLWLNGNLVKTSKGGNTLDNGFGGQTIVSDTVYLSTQSGAAHGSPGIALQGWNGTAAVGARIYGQQAGGWYSANWANSVVTFQVDDTGRITTTNDMTLRGDILSDGNERHFRASAANVNWGYFVNNTAIGAYDWQNGRGIFNYDPSANAFYVNTPTLYVNTLSVTGSGGSFANSKAANGYQKLPGGLILQWGTTGAITIGNPGAGNTITFPIAFPSACINVVGSVAGPASVTIGTSNYTASNFALYASSATAGGAITATWFAIGY